MSALTAKLVVEPKDPPRLSDAPFYLKPTLHFYSVEFGLLPTTGPFQI